MNSSILIKTSEWTELCPWLGTQLCWTYTYSAVFITAKFNLRIITLTYATIFKIFLIILLTFWSRGRTYLSMESYTEACELWRNASQLKPVNEKGCIMHLYFV